MTKDEALKMALEFVASISPAFICEATHHKKNEEHASNEPCPHVKKQKQTYEAIKEALAQAEFDRVHEVLEKNAGIHVSQQAQPEQEPVAWYRDEDGIRIYYESKVWDDATPLYITPPQRKEPEQEPVAWLTEERYAEMHTSKWTPKIQQVFSKDGILESQTIQYAPQSKTVPYPPAQRTWVGLSDEEAVQTWEGVIKYAPGDVRIKDFARAIEAKLKEKNT